jgi:hypothetical protein
MELQPIMNSRNFQEATNDFTTKVLDNKFFAFYLLDSNTQDRKSELKITKCQHVVLLSLQQMQVKKSICDTCKKSIKIKDCQPIDKNLVAMLESVKEFYEITNKLQELKNHISNKELEKLRLDCKDRIVKKLKKDRSNNLSWGIKEGKIVEVKLITLLTSNYPYVQEGECAPWLKSSFDIDEFCEELEVETGLNIYYVHTPIQMGYSFSFAAHFYASY